MSKLQSLEDSFGPRRQARRHDKPIQGFDFASRHARVVAAKTSARSLPILSASNVIWCDRRNLMQHLNARMDTTQAGKH